MAAPRSLRSGSVALTFTCCLVACESSAPLYEARPLGVTTPNGTAAPAIYPSDAWLSAVDPQLEGFDGWPLRFSVYRSNATQICRAEIRREMRLVRTIAGTARMGACVVDWDVRDTSGALVTPGALTIEGQIVDASGAVLARTTAQGEVLRVGIDRIDLSGDPGARQPLLYRAMGGQRDGFFEMPITFTPFRMGADASEGAASALVNTDGSAREVPMPWASLTSPPLERNGAAERDTYNLPTAWIHGSSVDFAMHLSSDLPGMNAGGSPRAVEVRVVAPEGLTNVGASAFEDDATITMRGAPVTSVDRVDARYAFTFEVRVRGGAWQPMPGAFEVMLRFYGLAGVPMFARSDLPHRPWVDVVDTITRWVDGTASDQAGVGAAIVRGVYEESGLRYDRVSGASVYSNYLDGWGQGIFDMQAFQERRNGSVINCSDAASIVSSYANMIGLDFRYRILTHRSAGGFRLNYLRGIGASEFTASPFESGRNSFRYHAIVNSRDVQTWDATLAVDGDGMPTMAPFTLRYVTGLAPMTYLAALSPEPTNIVTERDDNVRIR